MHIGRVISGFPPVKNTGPTGLASRLSKIQAAKGDECTVVTTGSNRKTQYETRSGYRIVWYPVLAQKGSIQITPGFSRIVSEIEADIFHLHEYRSLQVESAARTLVKSRIPYILTAHGSITSMYYYSKSLPEKLPHMLYDVLTKRFVLENAAAIVASCKSEALQMIRVGINPNKIRIIPHGIDTPRNIDYLKHDSSQEQNNLLFVGRIAYSRNLPMILKAFAMAKFDLPKLHLTICGDFLPESSFASKTKHSLQIRKLLNKLDLNQSVTFKGWKSGADLWKEYLSAQLFLWASRYDNFAHALLEAALCKMPLISTPVGVAPELIGHDEGGFLVGQNDFRDMGKKIVYLMENEHQRLDCGQKAYAKAIHFSEAAMRDSYEMLYNEII